MSQPKPKQNGGSATAQPKRVSARTNAVSSCGLEMSFTFCVLMPDAAVDLGSPLGGVCAMGVAPGSGVPGLDLLSTFLSGVDEGVTLRGSAPAGIRAEL